jgi:hypothetical protein
VPCGRTPSCSNFGPNTRAGAAGFDDDLPDETLRPPREDEDDLEPERRRSLAEEPREREEPELSRESPLSTESLSSSKSLLRLERADDERELREEDEPRPPPLERDDEREDDILAIAQSHATRRSTLTIAVSAWARPWLLGTP